MIITFFGHSRIASDSRAIHDKTTEIMQKLLCSEPESEFYCGHRGQFDILCESCLDMLRPSFNKFKKIYITPYYDLQWQKNQLNHISKDFDEIIFPPPCESCPPKYAWSRRNRWMVDNADLIISCVKYSCGGAAATIGYARRRGKNIISL